MSSVGLQPHAETTPRPAVPRPVFGWLPYLCALLLMLLSIGLYYPVRSHPFVNYDDNVYVTENLHVQGGMSWDTVAWAWDSFDAGNWHPVTWLSHALDYQWFGDKPAGHHTVNMLLHALNAALVFWVLFRATGSLGRSLMVAALFAVHPLNVESTVWIAERKTVLSMTFFLLALGAYHWYASRPHAGRYVTVAVLFGLGLMAKPQIITFPFVLLLWDYWPLRRMKLAGQADNTSARLPGKKLWSLILEKIPLFAIAVASAAMTMKAQAASGAVLSLKSIPFSMRLANAIVSYAKYVEKMIWPAKLAPMYPHPGPWLPSWQVYGSLLFLIVATVLAVEHRERRYLAVGWFWFLGTLVPMIGLVQVGRQAMADRYAYLPLLGLFIIVCWGVSDLCGAKHVPTSILATSGLIAIVVLTVVTHRQINYWADNVVLWRHTIAVTAPNYIAQDNLGSALLHVNRPEEAIGHYRIAAALHPTDPVSFFSIAMYEQQHGALLQAIDDYKRAITLTTSFSIKAKAYQNMGIAYRDLGNADMAQQSFAEANRLQGP